VGEAKFDLTGYDFQILLYFYGYGLDTFPNTPFELCAQVLWEYSIHEEIEPPQVSITMFN